MEMLALVLVIASIFGSPEDSTFPTPQSSVASEAQPILVKDLFGLKDVLPPPSAACLCARVCGRAKLPMAGASPSAGPCYRLRDELVYDAYASCDCGPVSRPSQELHENQSPRLPDVMSPNR